MQYQDNYSSQTTLENNNNNQILKQEYSPNKTDSTQNIQNNINFDCSPFQETPKNHEDNSINDIDELKQEEFTTNDTKKPQDILEFKHNYKTRINIDKPGKLLNKQNGENNGNHEQAKQGIKMTNDNDNDLKNLNNAANNHEDALNKSSQVIANTINSIYIVKNNDTGETYDIRNVDANKIIIPMQTTTVKLKTRAWASKGNKTRASNEALWDAAERGQLDKVKQLLDEKRYFYLAQVNSRLLDNWTALHLAVNEGHLYVCEYLLTKNANLEAKTSISRTPLHIASLRGYFDIVKLLVDSKADVNAVDQDFNTPLHYAADHGYMEIIKYLILHGANPILKNCEGLNAIDMSYNDEIRKIFESMGVFNDNLACEFSRSFIDGLILFTSRKDILLKLIYSTQQEQIPLQNYDAQTSSSSQPLQTMNNQSKYKVYGRTIKINIVNINAFKMKKLMFGLFPTEEIIGPHSFLIFNVLGKGSFAKVYLVEKISNQKLYAMKVLKKSLIFNQNLIRYVQSERNVLSIMSHPFIVKLHYAFQTEDNLYLILDLCPGGSLENLITKKKKLPEDVARIYAAEVLLALEALHKNDIIYRDLKPDNVVIDNEGHALLTDFGLSKEGINKNLTNSFCGSVAYLAPEILKKAGHNRIVDWYLLGLLIYEMTFGVPPYFDPVREKMLANIEKGELKMPRPVSKDLENIITKLLIKDPQTRLGSKNDAEEIKKHAWFGSINWEDAYNRKLKPPLPDIQQQIKRLHKGRRIHDRLVRKDEEDKNKISNWTFILPEDKS